MQPRFFEEGFQLFYIAPTEFGYFVIDTFGCLLKVAVFDKREIDQL